MANRNKDLYEILKLKKDCSTYEIKKAFIKLSKECHPDRNENTKDSHNKFVDINEAYSTLSNPLKRKQYDEFLRANRSINYNTNTSHNSYGASYTNERAYDFASGTAPNSNKSKNYYGSRLLLRLIALPKSIIVLTLVLLSVVSGGIQIGVINNRVKARREIMANQSRMTSLLLSHAKRQGKLLGMEEQFKRLQEGTLGEMNMSEILDEYLNDTEFSQPKPK